MEILENKNDCCGCTACLNSCPFDAIEMVPDATGFKYPEIDDEKCTECTLCIERCPALKKCEFNHKPNVFAVKHKDNRIRNTSTSGGMFTALCQSIFAKNGVVYGVTFDDKFRVHHDRAENLTDCQKLKTSKYVQSDLGKTFQSVKKDLKADFHVLFTGTPCQIAGLKSFLGKKAYPKLLLCDLICLGIPSPFIWSDYVNFIQKEYQSSIIAFQFRHKESGWHYSSAWAVLDNNQVLFKEPVIDIYNTLFYKSYTIRPSCYNCSFSSINRVSDMTIGDFWGIEKTNLKEFDDDRGTSLVLINTEKGAQVFSEIQDLLSVEGSVVEDCLQPALVGPAKIPVKRDQFWSDYHQYGFETVAKKYTKYGLIQK